MKRAISVILSIVLLFCGIAISFLVEFAKGGAKADASEPEYATMKVEYSDAYGTRENLKVMLLDKYVYVDAYELGERLGYIVGDTDQECVTIFNNENEELPFCVTQFYYDSTKVIHLIFEHEVEYKAPAPTIKNDEGTWIPFQYTLLMLNGNLLIVEDVVEIIMPQRSIIDAFYNIRNLTDYFVFDWKDDLGATDEWLFIQNETSYMSKLLDGVLKFDESSMVQLFRKYALDYSTYDMKYGEEVAKLFCAKPYQEFINIGKQMKDLNNVLNDDGVLAKILDKFNGQVDKLNSLQGIIDKNGNKSNNRSLQQLQKGIDGISEWKGIWENMSLGLDLISAAVEIEGYLEEYQARDTFAISAMKEYLRKAKKSGTCMPDASINSMSTYVQAIEKSWKDYSGYEYIKNNIVSWIKEGLNVSDVLIGDSKILLKAWSLASDYIPFLSDGLSSADNFEISLYAYTMQMDAYDKYIKYRSELLEDSSRINAENLNTLSMYCYAYLKSCYIAREAAVASLKSGEFLEKEAYEKVVMQQNAINEVIAKYLAIVSRANINNQPELFTEQYLN